MSLSKDVRTVPLTLVDVDGKTHLSGVIEPTYISLRIGAHNISSNIGLICNLLKLKARQKEMKCCFSFLSDVNIFRRVLKVSPPSSPSCFLMY